MRHQVRPFLFAISFLLAVSMLLSACGSQKANPPTPTNTPLANTPVPIIRPTDTTIPMLTPPPGTHTSAPTPGDAQAALLAAFTKLSTAYPYLLTELTTGAFDIDRTTDYAAADRVHSSWVIAPSPDRRETITIGNQTWWKLNGTWDPNPSDTNTPFDLYALLAPSIHDVQYVGQETANGAPCFVFSYSLTLNGDPYFLDGSGKVWVGIADDLPRQLDLNGIINGTSLTTQLVYSYGVQFDIQPPP